MAKKREPIDDLIDAHHWLSRQPERRPGDVTVRIRSVKIENYKCFEGTGTLELDPHMNLLVGKNNSGKSSFLEALQRIPKARPHRRYGIERA